MKPPRFAYQRAETIEEACAALAELGDDARILAGGQSLVPMLNFRLARPKLLVDISRMTSPPPLAGGGRGEGAVAAVPGQFRTPSPPRPWPVSRPKSARGGGAR